MKRASPANADIGQGSGISAINLSGASSSVSFLRRIVLRTVGACPILKSGFEMVRTAPMGAGIPAGELVFILSLCIIDARSLLPKMASGVWILPIPVWWGMSLSGAAIDTSVGSVWSFRDASQRECILGIVGNRLMVEPQQDARLTTVNCRAFAPERAASVSST
ncbi:MAG: hypothetical protein ABSG62_03275 [Terracidiphilus sp.]|jgi:hypothetical protein